MKRFFIKAVSATFLLFVSTASFCVIIAVSLFLHSFYDIPDYKALYKDSLPLCTRIYGLDGSLLTEFFHEHRVFISIEMIPEKLIQAFLVTEDKSFYDNSGIDVSGIIRALIKNIFSFRDNRLVGGSTITQQVVKNYILGNEKSLKRKIQEAILALKISNSFSKNQIMELYLNKIYLGNGAYGVVSAALKYFGKNLDRLSLSEFALLAAMPQAPSKLDPFKNYYKAKERRDWVLIRMYEEGFITEDAVIRARLSPINLSRKYSEHFITGDYFLEELRRGLYKDYGDKLYTGGLYVRSTLNTKYQSNAIQALKNGLIDYDRKNGWRGPLAIVKNLDNWHDELMKLGSPAGIGNWSMGVILEIVDQSAKVGLKNTKIAEISDISWAKGIKIGDVVIIEDVSKNYDISTEFSIRQIPDVNGGIVVMEVDTGKILAMVGGYDFIKSQFNTVTQAMRQPGSLFKPFVYITALENHFTPSTIIDDEKISLFQGDQLDLWEPKNYGNDFMGPTTLRSGLEKSRNVVTVRIASALGIDSVMKTAKKFGIYSEMKYNLSASLGSEVTTLLSMTVAYAIIANGGRQIKPQLYEKIQDRNGKNLFLLDGKACDNCNDPSSVPRIRSDDTRVIDEVHAAQVVSILEGVVKRGTARKLKLFGITLAGKTGTTNNNNDAWFIGFNSKIVIGVYVGYDQSRTLGYNSTGASVALPIFADFIKNIVDDVENVPFSTPKGARFVMINPKTGEVTSDSYNAILECYKEGTQPIPHNNMYE